MRRRRVSVCLILLAWPQLRSLTIGSKINQDDEQPHHRQYHPDLQQSSLSNPPSSASRKDVLVTDSNIHRENQEKNRLFGLDEIVYLTQYRPEISQERNVFSASCGLEDEYFEQLKKENMFSWQVSTTPTPPHLQTQTQSLSEEEGHPKSIHGSKETLKGKVQEKEIRAMPSETLAGSKAMTDDTTTIDREVPKEYHHYANENYPGRHPRRPTRHSSTSKDPKFPHYGGQQQGRPWNPDPQEDSVYFYGRVNAQGRQVNLEDNTLVRFQILDHRIVFPEEAYIPGVEQMLSRLEEMADFLKGPGGLGWKRKAMVDQRIGTKFYKPQVTPQQIRVSDWYPASTTRHRLAPSTKHLKEAEEPEVLSTVWKRLYWHRASDRLKVLEVKDVDEDGSLKPESVANPDRRMDPWLISPSIIKQSPNLVPVPDLWKRVIRDTVRSSCDTANGFSYDEHWDPQAYEHERVGLYPGMGGDPSNLDGYFKEFSSPRCPGVWWFDRWPDYAPAHTGGLVTGPDDDLEPSESTYKMDFVNAIKSMRFIVEFMF
ncbi:hypothetical protein BGZ83_001729 [Gryganskiella cystojenkinii]|nr:hypothetical protein BGZ83_001729 [Gryganskiella cystojenkinii]